MSAFIILMLLKALCNSIHMDSQKSRLIQKIIQLMHTEIHKSKKKIVFLKSLGSLMKLCMPTKIRNKCII